MIDLGKYAPYIYPAYGLTIAFFAWVTADSLLSARRWKREAARLQAEKDAAK
jgi:heme exporter protein D